MKRTNSDVRAREKGFVVPDGKPGTPKDTAAPSGSATVRPSPAALELPSDHLDTRHHERRVAERMQDPEFRKAYEKSRAEIALQQEGSNMNKRVWFYAAATFAAITVANLISIRFGASASVFNAFFLIGLVLVTRDAIHDELSGWRLTAFLGGLIAAGGAAAYVLTATLSSAPPEIAEAIAKASMLAFMAAETVDAIVYQVLHRQRWTVRANLSNLPAAAVDSVIFAWVAFEAPWSVGGAQFFAKVIGGLVWVAVIGWWRSRSSAEPAFA